MQHIGSRPTLLAMSITAILGTSSSIAQERTNTEALETVVVTATRIEQHLGDIARSIAVVDKVELESIQPQSVAQALSYQPNISVAGGPRAYNQTVNIRGLQGNKILQTIDGSRQDFESGHRPSYFLDPELLESVEAMRGPASSLWGSGALGGVVAQNTISADSILEESEQLGGFVKTGYNDNNEQSTTTVAMVGRTGPTDWLISGYYRDSDDIELGNGEDLQGSGTEDKGALAKLNWELAHGHQLGFNLRAAETEGNIPTNGSAPLGGTSNWLIARDQTTTNASIRYEFDTSERINGEVLAYWNSVDMDEQRLEDGRADQTELDTYGLSVNNVSALGDITLLYGADAYREEFNADRSGADRPAPPEAQSDFWSVYTQAVIPVSEDWRLELGLRYDDFSTEADNIGEQRSDDDISTSAAAIWSATEWATLALRYDEAFRAPGAEELYSTGTHFCLWPGFCNGFQPNPDLDPEKAANIELLAQFQFENVAGADALRLQASVFRNEVDDFIEQIVDGPHFFPVQDAGFTTWVNVDEATLEGFEVEGSYQRGGTALKMSYGQTRGEDDNSKDDLTNIPADSFIADLSHAFFSHQFVAGIRFTHADDQNRTDYPENENGTSYDSYNIVDLYASWQPAALEGLKIDLNINNLDDEYYSRAWEELPEAGREIILSAKYSF